MKTKKIQILVVGTLLLLLVIIVLIFNGYFFSLGYALIITGWSYFFYGKSKKNKKYYQYILNSLAIAFLYYGLPKLIFGTTYQHSGAIGDLAISIFIFWLFGAGIFNSIGKIYQGKNKNKDKDE